MVTIPILAWDFDTGFWSNRGDHHAYGWDVEYIDPGGHDNDYEHFTAPRPGDQIDLGDRITDIQLTTRIDDEKIQIGDEVGFNGKILPITAVFDGESMVIDGTRHRVLTIYAGTFPGEVDPRPHAFTIPVDLVTGKLSDAFPGHVSESISRMHQKNFHLSRDRELSGDDLPLIWFAFGTAIMTARGDVRAEELRVGDLVMTRDHGLQPIYWVARRKLDATFLTANPEIRPIRIRAGALGHGQPGRDLIVSPRHRVLVRSRIAQRLFGTNEVLVAARQLLAIEGIEIANDLADMDYVHFLLNDHQLVFADGAETESLCIGPQVMHSIGPAVMEEILTAFPELRNRTEDEIALGPRPFLTGRQGRKLADRHARNRQPLVM